MVKKSFLLISILFVFLLPFVNVNAEILPKPTAIDIESFDYGITNSNSYNATTTTWYDINTYIANNDFNGFVYDHSSRQNFWYPNNICNNKEITINVKTLAYYTAGNFYEQTTPLKLWNGSTAYTCTLNSTSNNGNVADWTCTGVISNVLMLTFESIDILSTERYGVGISNSSTYTCNATTSDIINNQNSNANNIINNQNSNANNIINNQDKNQQQTNEKLDNIDDTLNNSDIDNPNFEEFEEYISENGVITQLITLPVRLYTQILNSINSNCTPFVLGELFEHNLVMNCINPVNFFGSVLWNTIDILGTGLFIYVISKKMIAVFNKFTNLEEGDILD